jgi:large subunit ribosomal protein L21
MYAVLRSGNKQFPVSVGSVIKVDRLQQYDVGSSVMMDDVLFAATPDGNMVPGNVAVQVEVLEHRRDEKLIVFKKRRRKNSRRKRGFRHSITVLRVQDILSV